MPALVRPKHPDPLEAAISVFGNRATVAILRTVRLHGPIGCARIARLLDMTQSTTSKRLASLEAAGAITGDPPAGTDRQGKHVQYTYNTAAVARLYAELGDALGLP